MSSKIIKFYKNEKVHLYTFNDIMNFSDKELENIHNYIQWLFPTNDKNNIRFGKPFLAEEDILIIKNDKEILLNIYKALNKMFDFYFNNKQWLTKNNHNYLRITRILIFLSLINTQELNLIKKMFYNNNKNIIGETSFNFWTKSYKNESIE